ncbi:hypothetical protein [Nitrosovibrio sp. Nv6]|uniref:hypothetical protein n=1 Tax=Nitrosovibrio sp. Nv6 TaxID=1855340 RepID=UPI0008CE2577|nr:hypothetical protein [Nitrosovibrio sp. Nv6]SEP38990.1 hypothetical protein SAMN05216316_2747 [Nitrosovibrio sp. Nv6]
MNKLIIALAPLLSACLLTACAGIGLKEETETRGAKFAGNHLALAHCVISNLQSDNRWVIRGLQYDVRRYPDLEATEIYAYEYGSLPGTYARNSPLNPDAVFRHGPPPPKIQQYKPNADTRGDINPDYSFVLMIKRTDNATVFATLNGKKYEGDIAWEKLKACSNP